MAGLKKDFYDGIAAIVAAILLIIGAMQIDLRLWDGRGMSPRAFPIFISCLIMLFGIFVSIKAVLDKTEEKAQPQIPSIDFSIAAHKLRIPAPILIMLLMIIFFIVMPYLGFIVSASLYLFVLFYLLRPGKTIQSIIISVAATGIIFCIFFYGFNVRLPLGFGL